MHSSSFDDPGNDATIVIHHNGGYDGTVIITRVLDGANERDSEFEVDFEVLKMFVAKWAAQERVSRLETASADDILLGRT